MMVHTRDVDMEGLGQWFWIYFCPYRTDK